MVSFRRESVEMLDALVEPSSNHQTTFHDLYSYSTMDAYPPDVAITFSASPYFSPPHNKHVA